MIKCSTLTLSSMILTGDGFALPAIILCEEVLKPEGIFLEVKYYLAFKGEREIKLCRRRKVAKQCLFTEGKRRFEMYFFNDFFY